MELPIYKADWQENDIRQ